MLDLKSQLGLEVRQVGNLGPVGHILEDVISLNDDFENLNDFHFLSSKLLETIKIKSIFQIHLIEGVLGRKGF